MSAGAEASPPVSFADVALRLHENGYAVVPIAPRGFRYRRKGKTVEASGKGPVEHGWQSFGDGQTTEDVARLVVKHPTWGVGILHQHTPGIDVDVSHDASAREIHALAVATFGELPARFGRAPRRMLIGSTDEPFARIKSADYRMPGDRPGDKPHSVEVRCRDQQFVAFGIHPDTGGPYLWEDASPLTVPRSELPPISAEAAARFVGEAAAVIGRYGGEPTKTLRQRGDAAPKTSGALRARDPEMAREWLRVIPNDDLSRDDWVYMAHAIKGALGEDGYGDFLEFSRRSEKHHHDETVRQLWDSAKPDRIGAGTLRYLAEEEGWRPQSKTMRGAIEIVDFEDLIEPDLETRSIVKGILDAGAQAIVYGESGSGKTFWTLDLALSAASGCDWFGRQTTTARVVYVAAEAGRKIRNRVAAWAQEKRKDNRKIAFRVVTSPIDLCHPREWDVDRLIEAVGEADLVIIDTVARTLAGGNENAPDDMGAFVRALDLLRDRLGCAVLAVHHVGKDPARRARGHSSLHCAVDTEIFIEKREGGVSVATITKQRDGPEGQQIAFCLRSVTLGYDQDDAPVTSCVVDPADWTPPAKAKGPTGQAKVALDVLMEVVAGRGDQLDGAGRGACIEDWHAALKRSGRLGDPDTSTFRNAWARVQSKLREGGHIEFRGDRVWPTTRDDEIPM